MATLRLEATKAKPHGNGYSGFAVVYDLTGTADKYPTRIVEVRNTAEALAALETYKAEATLTGSPLAITASFVGRAPNGWKKTPEAIQFYHGVNV